VDVCKWLGISLVIFGHMKMPNEVLQWIYAFHMPLFFVLSGYTYRAQRIDKEFLMKKIKTIYVPFLLFALIFCRGEMSSWAYIAYGSRNALDMAGTYTVLWFLPCFFAAVLVFSSLMNIGNRSKHKVWILAAGVVVMLAGAKACEMLKGGQPMIAKYGYPLNFDMALVGAVFMVAGYYFRQMIDWINTQRQWLLIVTVVALFAVTGFTAFMNLPESLNPACAHVEMSVGAFGNWGLFFANALLMSMALIGLSVLVDKWVIRKNLLLFIGQNSLTILCVHGTILLVASKVLPKMGLVGVDDMSLMLQGIVSYVIVIAVSIPAILLIKRFVPNLVGK
ncbi:MAG: acyltransferase family protein, partial [Muribaculaceae bacterium]|nr:acyltransferase family protein [Muribaculaceae bacterium]